MNHLFEMLSEVKLMYSAHPGATLDICGKHEGLWRCCDHNLEKLLKTSLQHFVHKEKKNHNSHCNPDLWPLNSNHFIPESNRCWWDIVSYSLGYMWTTPQKLLLPLRGEKGSLNNCISMTTGETPRWKYCDMIKSSRTATDWILQCTDFILSFCFQDQ